MSIDDINKILDESVRPLIEADGGAIEVLSLDESSIQIKLSDGCAGCPGRSLTWTKIVEPVLRSKLGSEIKIALVS